MANIIDTIKSFNGSDLKVYDSNYDNSQMNQEDFLKVLLANFEYQDPFEAQDISKFIDNTIKLRELEVMNKFENAVSLMNSPDNMILTASNLIGKNVEYEGDKTYFENGKSQVEFEVTSNAQIVTIYIYDKNGKLIDQKELTNLEPNQKYSINFENNIDDGYYNVAINAKNGENSVDTKIYSLAKIKGVERSNDSLLFVFDEGKLELKDLYKIGG